MESGVLQRGVRGAAQHGMWRAGGRLLDEMDKRGEDFRVRRGREQWRVKAEYVRQIRVGRC